MQAIVINQYGNAINLQPAVLEKPTPAAGQVLIRVAAAGLNPVDFHVRNGMLAGTDTHQLPLVLGWDASGVIETLGSGVQNWQVGDAVMVHTPINLQGTYSEYIVADAGLLAPKPASLNLLQAAALPLAGLTAWQGMMVDGQLQAGQRVLIHNASGGVGSFAVQLAKAAGAHVTATASARKRDLVLALGADRFVDYTQAPFEQQLAAEEAFDLVFAATGGNDLLPRSLALIKRGGHLISTFDEMDEAQAQAAGVHYQRMWVHPNGAQLQELGRLADEGKLKVVLDSVFPLAEAQAAHRHLESQKVVGKSVLNIDPTIIA